MKKIISVKIKYIISFFLCLMIGVGIYSIWSYKMNYEMIMRYTDLDENAPDFPFGQKKVDARYWILEKKFSKIDDNKIYNPRINHLEKNPKLKRAIVECIEDNKIVYPILYKKFNEKKILSNFENDLVTIYLFSVFNEYTLSPDRDYFLIKFDKYEGLCCTNLSVKGFSAI